MSVNAAMTWHVADVDRDMTWRLEAYGGILRMSSMEYRVAGDTENSSDSRTRGGTQEMKCMRMIDGTV